MRPRFGPDWPRSKSKSVLDLGGAALASCRRRYGNGVIARRNCKFSKESRNNRRPNFCVGGLSQFIDNDLRQFGRLAPAIFDCKVTFALQIVPA